MTKKYSPLVQNIVLENIINHKDPIIIYAKSDPISKYESEKLIFWNTSMEELTGYSFEEVEGKEQDDINQLLYGHDRDELDKVLGELSRLDRYGISDSNLVFSLRTKEGRIRQIAWRIEKKYGGGIICYGSTEQVEIQRVLRKDPAFNCLNVNALNQDFIKILSASRNSDSQIYPNTLSCVFGDIDYFKQFNDTYGHKMGDKVLEYVIAFLKFEFRRDGDGIYRKGGDEFVLLCDKTSEKNTFNKIEKVRARLASTNIIATYNNGNLRTSYIKHTSEEAANKYFKNKEVKKQNEKILQDMGMMKTSKGIIKTDNCNLNGVLVLPPIGSTWGVVEYNYERKEAMEKEIEVVRTEIIDGADKLMYNGKRHSKGVVFTKAIVDNLSKEAIKLP